MLPVLMPELLLLMLVPLLLPVPLLMPPLDMPVLVAPLLPIPAVPPLMLPPVPVVVPAPVPPAPIVPVPPLLPVPPAPELDCATAQVVPSKSDNAIAVVNDLIVMANISVLLITENNAACGSRVSAR